jgi:hypothetical protein
LAGEPGKGAFDTRPGHIIRFGDKFFLLPALEVGIGDELHTHGDQHGGHHQKNHGHHHGLAPLGRGEHPGIKQGSFGKGLEIIRSFPAKFLIKILNFGISLHFLTPLSVEVFKSWKMLVFGAATPPVRQSGLVTNSFA